MMEPTKPDPFRGRERRRYDRSLATSPKVIGRARFVQRAQVAPPANFPTDRWYPVMDRGHETRLQARPGYVWLGFDGAEHQVELVQLEVETLRTGGSR
jgi:hypothetical protein